MEEGVPTVGDEGIHLSRAVIYEGASGQRKGVAGINHVIYQDRDLWVEAVAAWSAQPIGEKLEFRIYQPCHVHLQQGPPSSPARQGSVSVPCE